MNIYEIHTKADKVVIEAASRPEAFARYFKDVIDGKVTIDQLGNIIMLKDERGEEYGLRTVPILWKMGVIDDDMAIASLLSIGVADSRNAARRLLKQTADKDAWIAEEIDKLAEKEILSL